jgi:2,3-dihydroxybenzoate decarboxylase
MYQRIATEEAFAPPEILDRYRILFDDGSYNDPGFKSLCGFIWAIPARALCKLSLV